MVLFRMRSMTAAVLSLWLGVLACLLGCANPAAASTRSPTPEHGMAICPEGGHDAGDSCCQHSHGNPNKSSHHAKSCCPTETALTERKSAPIVLSVSVDVVTPALPVAVEFAVEFASVGATLPTLWDGGRGILRRVHVLRI
jgi:hypothetical protein